MIIVDTNIIIYAINQRSPKHEQAQSFLNQEASYGYFHQQFFESIRVLTHPTFPSHMTIRKAIDAVHRIVSCGTILSPTRETYDIAPELLKTLHATGNRVFDVYLVASMLSYGLTTLATDNERDFRMFSMIKVINPFSL